MPVDRLVCAVSSGGTAAGLALGTALLGWPVTIDLACVSDNEEDSLAEVGRLVGDAAALLGVPVPALDHVQATDRALGPGYGLPTEQRWSAIRLFARTEGITLDPVYTGKAAAALVGGVACGAVGAGETVLFVHTGGLPSLFGYAPELADAVDIGAASARGGQL
jgi:D-cysteine desulfhydrase